MLLPCPRIESKGRFRASRSLRRLGFAAVAIAILAFGRGVSAQCTGDCCATPACFESWFIDATNVPSCGNLACGTDKLRYYRVDRLGRHLVSRHEFLMAMSPSKPVVFFIHGYGFGPIGATRTGKELSAAAGKGALPFQLVVWGWDSRHYFLQGLGKNLEEKTHLGNVQGYYLAHLIRDFDPRTPVSLVGHSFGCKAVLSTLNGLACNQVLGCPLPQRSAQSPIEAMLIAPAVTTDCLNANAEYGFALTQVDRMLITWNRQDRVLRGFGAYIENRCLLGLTGPPEEVDIIAPGKVASIDVESLVGNAHMVPRYSSSRKMTTMLAPFLVYDEALCASF